jgi:hypothetical protein
MDRSEAKSILAKELTKFAARPYDKLVASIKHPDVKNADDSTVCAEPGAFVVKPRNIGLAIVMKSLVEIV